MSDKEEKQRISDAKFMENYKKQLELIKKRDDYVQRETEKKEEKLKKELTFSPKISKRAKQVKTVGYDFRVQWDDQRKKNLELLKTKKDNALNQSLKQFELTKETEKIIQNSGYVNPVDGWEERFEKFKKKSEIPEVDRSAFSPRVSKKTIELTKNREGEVFDRLYLENEEKIKRLQQKKLESQQKFQPETTETKKKPRRNVFESLYDVSKKEQVNKKTFTKPWKNVEFSHQPQINPLSEEMIKTVKRTPLYSPKIKKVKEEPKQKKTLTKKEEEKMQKRFEKIYNNNIKFILKKEQFVKKYKEFNEVMEQKECTFEPVLSPISKKIMRMKNYKFDYGLEKNKKYEQFLLNHTMRKEKEYESAFKIPEELKEQEEEYQTTTIKKGKKMKVFGETVYSRDEDEIHNHQMRKEEKEKEKETKKDEHKNEENEEDGELFAEIEGIEDDVSDCLNEWEQLMKN